MERRNFLRLLTGGASALVAPSLVWPFRKIFLPAIVEPPLELSVWFATQGLWDRPDAGMLTGIAIPSFEEQVAYNSQLASKWLGLSRAIYPGPLSVKTISEIQQRFAEPYVVD
jgi:hypothetical protein